jgi:hypothetical protein
VSVNASLTVISRSFASRIMAVHMRSRQSIRPCGSLRIVSQMRRVSGNANS